MFHNYFFLKRLATELNDALTGLSLMECFSQNKDELILGFANKEKEFYLRANLDPSISLISFPETFSRAGKNSIDLFSSLIHQQVKGVEVFLFERSFKVMFEIDDLIFKMHARRGNILHAKKNEVIDVFRKSLINDIHIDPNSLHQEVDITKDNFKLHGSDPIRLLPALGKETKLFLEQQNYYELDENDQWGKFQQLLQDLEKNQVYLHSHPLRISLLNPSDEKCDSAIQASNWLYDKTVRFFYFDKERTHGINKLKQRLKKTENYLIKTQQKLQQIENERSPEEIANVLMANLNQLQTGLSKAVLHDFYTDQPIEIKLNVKLSPQKNAENLYRKAKNRHQEIQMLRSNIEAKEKLLDEISRQILHIQDIKEVKELRTYMKQHGLFQKEKVQAEVLPYHEFEVDGWVIMLGKNAKANDELTLKVANKNDLWLHAKDVAGSHVVVRQRPGQNFPKHIIEKAASLAAANSKRKTDSLCPVIYTLKKYVRKSKGAPAGQVIVEKEEIVLIEPESIKFNPSDQ